MIKNNLAVILAERGLKMIDVITGTGINKNTISSLVNNKASGIQYETLDKLCDFLDVSPGELLIRHKFKVEVTRREFFDNEIDYFLKITLNDKTIESLARLKIGNDDSEETGIIWSANILQPLAMLPKEKVEEALSNSIMEHLHDNDPEIFHGMYKLDEKYMKNQKDPQ